VDTDKEFDAFSDEVPFVSIDRLRVLQTRAKRIIRRRSESQIREAAATIEWLTSEYFYTEKESWILRQLETGGSILRFLHYEDRTEYGLRELIDHHVGCDISEDELDFPTEENTLPLYALEEALKGFNLDDQYLPDAKPYEYIAILALVLIGQAIRSYQSDDWPRFLKDDLPMMRLSTLANDAVDIMEVVCRAEQLEEEFEARKVIATAFQDNEKRLSERAEELAKKKVSLAASLAANARHKETTRSKSAAIECWESTGSNYSSRTAFARNKHRDYGVTERALYGWITAHERLKA
jgi:hypothetical protein